MKILVIGGTGTIGKKIVAHFSKDHEVLIAGRNSKDYPVDIADTKSIKTLFKKSRRQASWTLLFVRLGKQNGHLSRICQNLISTLACAVS